MKTVQYFSNDYLKECRKLSTMDIIKFLDDFRILNSEQPNDKTKLISIKIPVTLLNAFKSKSQISGVKYQTQIKLLMKKWLST